MHIPTYKKATGTDKIVLFIHGLMGSPNQFCDLANAVYDNGCAYLSVLLPGHGSSMNEFVKFGVSDWTQHIQNEIDKIKHDYKKIFLVGHSMGGLLALNASLIRENNISGIVLISTPLKIHLLNLKSLWLKLYLLFLPKNNEIKATYIKSNSITKSKLFFYPSIVKPLFHFLKLVKITKKHLREVFIPVYMFYSKNDETTSYKNADLLCKMLCNTEKTVFSLYKSWHAFSYDDERKIIKDKIIEFIQQIGTDSK